MKVDESVLKHWGILGMKWGVRRSEAQLARARGEQDPDAEDGLARARVSTDPKLVAKYKDQLTDTELRERLNRIQMEKQLSDINAANRAAEKQVIMKKVEGIIKIGKTANEVYNLIQSPLGKEIQNRVKNARKKK